MENNVINKYRLEVNTITVRFLPIKSRPSLRFKNLGRLCNTSERKTTLIKQIAILVRKKRKGLFKRNSKAAKRTLINAIL